MATQWHPLFAELLRPLVEGYYEVQTNVPVGDVPREADLVLLRRTSAKTLPFQGLWRHLTPWNILEYKGPSVSARFEHLDLLIELGLGIHRRLNEERADSVPLHILAAEPVEKELELAQLVVQQPSLWELYGHFLGSLHPETLKELKAMARTAGKGPKFHVKPLIEWMGIKEVIDQVGLERVIDEVGVKRVIDEVGLARVLGEMMTNQAGKRKVLAYLLGNLSAAERADLKRRLDAKEK